MSNPSFSLEKITPPVWLSRKGHISRRKQRLHEMWLSSLKAVHSEKMKLGGKPGSSHCGSGPVKLTRIQEDVGLIPGLAQWAKDPASPWLCCRLAAIALIQPLDWELRYAAGVALKKTHTHTHTNLCEQRNLK